MRPAYIRYNSLEYTEAVLVLMTENTKNAVARGRAVRKLVREVGQEALHCSKWIYWLSEKREWESRKVS